MPMPRNSSFFHGVLRSRSARISCPQDPRNPDIWYAEIPVLLLHFSGIHVSEFHDSQRIKSSLSSRTPGSRNTEVPKHSFRDFSPDVWITPRVLPRMDGPDHFGTSPLAKSKDSLLCFPMSESPKWRSRDTCPPSRWMAQISLTVSGLSL
jgi:hypothetical protein